MTQASSLKPIALALLLAAFLPGGGCDTTIAGDGGGDGTGGDTGDTNADAPLPCSSNNPCPPGQFCFNGLCAIGCQSDQNCADNQYCNTSIQLCQNDDVHLCEDDGDCAETQICVYGYCSTPPSAGCNLEDPYDDGCPSNAMCLDPDGDDVGKCYTMQACAGDGTCPVGAQGALCNDGLLPNKDQICMLGLCDTPAHCPANWNCVRLQPNAAAGLCSDGSAGAPCNDGGQCASGVCLPVPGLDGGFCQ